MCTTVSLTKAQVPSYLVESAFYLNLGADGDDEFSIPQEYFKPSAHVATAAELAHLFHTMKFWGLSALPHDLIKVLISNPKPFADDEHDAIFKVLLEFDGEFGLLKLYQSLLECTNEQERISAALECGKEDVLEYLSRSDKLVNIALIKAVAENGHARLLQDVLDKYLKLSRKGPFKDVSMITVASCGHTDCLRILIEKGCKKHKDTCRAAAENGHLACLKLAHELGCMLNNTVCNAAAKHGHLYCLQYTLEHGCSADVDTLCAAAEGGHVECLRFVLEKGVKILKRACHNAAMSGNVDCLKLLRARGAPAWDVNCALQAAKYGHLACLEYLLNEGCKVDHTCTQHAAEAGQADCLELLLTRQCEARSDCVDRAAAGEHMACLRVLKKFNIEIDSHYGSEDLLTWRAFGRGIVYARSLFEAGYNIPQCTMTFAVNCGDVECVEFLCANKLCKLDKILTGQATKGTNRASLLQVLHKYNCPWGPHTCWHAAQNCDLESLTLAHEYGAPWEKNTTDAAIQVNGLECLMYALKEGCPLSENACEIAASRGLCHILQLLHERGCVLTLKTCVAAAKNKYSDCLTYAVTHGAPVDATVCEAAAKYVGSYHSYYAHQRNKIRETSLHMLECAHKLGCPWDARTCAVAAALSDGTKCLQYCRENGCPWDATTVKSAAQAGQVENLAYAMREDCPFTVDACIAAAEGGHLSSLQLLRAYQCPWDERVSEAAMSNGGTCLQYCVENGCPIDAHTMARYNAMHALVA